jgi:hypothetical protein
MHHVSQQVIAEHNLCCITQLVSRKCSKAEYKHLWQVTAQSQFSKYRSENKEEAHFSETRETRKVRGSAH